VVTVVGPEVEENGVGAEEDGAGAGGRIRWRQRRVLGGRRRFVQLRLTEDDYAKVAARAAAAGASIPAYLVMAGTRPQDSSVVTTGDPVLMRVWGQEMRGLRQQVYRVGLNVNQVARLLHGTGEVARNAEVTYRGAVRAIAALDPLIERFTGAPVGAGTLPSRDGWGTR
jgi:hypothetical protein